MSWLEMFKADAEKRNAESRAMQKEIRREKRLKRTNARCRKWRDAHPENAKESFRKSTRKYRNKLGRDVVNARQRKWRAAHPGKQAEYARRWRENHPERYEECKRRMRENYRLRKQQNQTETPKQQG